MWLVLKRGMGKLAEGSKGLQCSVSTAGSTTQYTVPSLAVFPALPKGNFLRIAILMRREKIAWGCAVGADDHIVHENCFRTDLSPV